MVANETSKAPVFSVMTPVLNGKAYMLRCYEMLRLQTFQDWEWVVVDDGSTDRTAELIRGLDDARISLISYTPNRGRGHARTTALEACRGEWVVVWDADDMYFPDRLERLNQSRLAGNDFACSYCVMVDNDLTVKGTRAFSPFSPSIPRLFVHLTLACRRELMAQIGYAPAFRTAEDVTMVYTLAGSMRHRGEWIDDALTICQEDREVHLQKAIDSNISLHRQLHQLQAAGMLGLSAGEYRRLRVRQWMKLGLLQLMRLYPPLYLKSVGRRTSGGALPGWTLSPDRQTFLAALKERWGPGGSSQLEASLPQEVAE
jgi:glycosyltransferase involved in cell wall biosynthesis